MCLNLKLCIFVIECYLILCCLTQEVSPDYSQTNLIHSMPDGSNQALVRQNTKHAKKITLEKKSQSKNAPEIKQVNNS